MTESEAQSLWRPQLGIGALLFTVMVAALLVFYFHDKPQRPTLQQSIFQLQEQLRRRSTDRESLVSKYEHLISWHSADPKIASAMSELAKVYETDSTKDKDRGYTWNEDLAIHWYRKSFEAELESSNRGLAGLRLAMRLRLRGSDSDLSEARQTLDALSPNSNLTAGRLKLEWTLLEIAARDYEAAERRCRPILDSSSFCLGTKMLAANRLVAAWPDSPESVAEKKQWIESMVIHHGDIPLLTLAAEAAIQRLEAELGDELGTQMSTETPKQSDVEWELVAYHCENGDKFPDDLLQYLPCNHTYILRAGTVDGVKANGGCLWKINDVVQPSDDSLLVYMIPEPPGPELSMDIFVEIRTR